MVPSKVHRNFSSRWWVYMGYLTVAGTFHWLMDSYPVERIPCTQHSLKRSTGLGLTTQGRYFVTTKLVYTMQSLIHGPKQQRGCHFHYTQTLCSVMSSRHFAMCCTLQKFTRFRSSVFNFKFQMIL